MLILRIQRETDVFTPLGVKTMIALNELREKKLHKKDAENKGDRHQSIDGE